MPKLVLQIFYFALCEKQFKSENTNKKIVFKNIHSMKNDQKHWKRRTLFKENKTNWCLGLL